MNPSKAKSVVLLSSLAKTELPPDILFKQKYLLPVVTLLGMTYNAFHTNIDLTDRMIATL